MKTYKNILITIIIANVVVLILTSFFTPTGHMLFGLLAAMSIIMILGAVYGAIYAGQIGKNKYLWGILCFLNPILFPLVLLILKSNGELSNYIKYGESNKYIKHILIGGFIIFIGFLATDASEGYIFWGAIVFGGIELIFGLIGWIRGFLQ